MRHLFMYLLALVLIIIAGLRLLDASKENNPHTLHNESPYIVGSHTAEVK